jgi:hypothetical protein
LPSTLAYEIEQQRSKILGLVSLVGISLWATCLVNTAPLTILHSERLPPGTFLNRTYLQVKYYSENTSMQTLAHCLMSMKSSSFFTSGLTKSTIWCTSGFMEKAQLSLRPSVCNSCFSKFASCFSNASLIM